MKGNYGEITKAILLSIGIAGVVVLVAAAPGVLLAAKLFEHSGGNFSKKRDREKAARAVQRLQKNQFIKIREKNGKFVIELTKKGKEKFKDLQLEKLEIIKPPKWDKKWRIVIFDIPDRSFKRGRDALRGKLKEWEFYQLQKSVWVCPWPCENEIQVIAELYGVAPYTNIVIADKILESASLQKHFGL
ncbi:MAG TPA: hypothetical protein VGA53_02850 [Candidatus Paceibacterota bacterium]